MKYNFDEIIERRNTDCVKYDAAHVFFGTNDLLPMWIADMDFRTPDFILEAIKERLSHPILAYFYHNEDFYNAIISWMERRHHWHIEKEWIHFSPGIVSGLAMLVQAFSNEGDNVIIQPPVYHPFYYVINHQHRNLVTNPLKLEEGTYKMDLEDLETKLKAGAKILILCNPHNPVGRCWTPEELRVLGELCLQYNCLVVSDEIHADLILPGYTHTPMASVSPQIANNTITCMAPSKTFNIAGLATSELIIPNLELGKKYEEYLDHRMHLQGGNTFGDVALVAAYTKGDEWLEELKLYIAENVRYAKEFIANHLPDIKTYHQEATYVLWVDFNGLGISHEELSKRLVDDAKLGFNDGRIFGDNGDCFMRINLACPKSLVEEAMTRIKKTFY